MQTDSKLSCPKILALINNTPMREEHTPPQKHMRLLARQLLEPLQDSIIKPPRSKLVNQLIIIDR
jgi:hypothetical protein